MNLGIFILGWATSVERWPLVAACAITGWVLSALVARAARYASAGVAWRVSMWVLICIVAALAGLAGRLAWEWVDAGQQCAAPFAPTRPCTLAEFALSPYRALTLVAFDAPLALLAAALATLTGWLAFARRRKTVA